ncbi:MAG TPA: hypothetical protein VGF27_20805 [Pseudoduganella sp.]
MLFLISTAFAALAGAAPALTPEQEAYARLPVCTLSKDGRHLAVEPCRTAPPKKLMPRRPVPQLSDPMPRMAAPKNTEIPQAAWAPTLTPATPPSAVAAASGNFTPGKAPVVPTLPALTPLPGPSAPIPVTCGPAGCRDAGGNIYNNPQGVSVSPTGKPCASNGMWMSCP